MQVTQADKEDWSNVDVSLMIKQFQTRINKMGPVTNGDCNNNSPEFFSRNIPKTRSRSLPSKYPMADHDGSVPEASVMEDVVSVEEDTAAVVSQPTNSDDEQHEALLLPSVRMLASKFTEYPRTRKITSKVLCYCLKRILIVKHFFFRIQKFLRC